MTKVDRAGASGGGSSAEALARLRGRLAREGLHIALPLDGARFAAVLGTVGRTTDDDLVAFARGAVVIGDGGGAFFARFVADDRRSVAIDDPLDEYTRATVERAVVDALGPGGAAVP